jgi:hypothetical protein
MKERCQKYGERVMCESVKSWTVQNGIHISQYHRADQGHSYFFSMSCYEAKILQTDHLRRGSNARLKSSAKIVRATLDSRKTS